MTAGTNPCAALSLGPTRLLPSPSARGGYAQPRQRGDFRSAAGQPGASLGPPAGMRERYRWSLLARAGPLALISRGSAGVRRAACIDLALFRCRRSASRQGRPRPPINQPCWDPFTHLPCVPPPSKPPGTRSSCKPRGRPPITRSAPPTPKSWTTAAASPAPSRPSPLPLPLPPQRRGPRRVLRRMPARAAAASAARCATLHWRVRTR
jgi:hypothetical protein